MKRISILVALLVASCSLAACGNNSKQAKENSSLAAENSSLKANKKKQEKSSSKAESESLKNSQSEQSIYTATPSKTEANTATSVDDSAERAAREVCAQEGLEYHPDRMQITPDGNGGYTVIARTVGSYHYSSNGDISKNPAY